MGLRLISKVSVFNFLLPRLRGNLYKTPAYMVLVSVILRQRPGDRAARARAMEIIVSQRSTYWPRPEISPVYQCRRLIRPRTPQRPIGRAAPLAKHSTRRPTVNWTRGLGAQALDEQAVY
jgi:hypothetical protein